MNIKIMNRELLKKLIGIQSYSGETRNMQLFLLEYAIQRKYKCETDALGNIVITKDLKGVATTPCMVAHMDTVHKIIPGTVIPIEIGDNIIAVSSDTKAQVGTGGDDKCGIYVALELLERLPTMKCVFVVDEEIGCVGSRFIALKHFLDCRFILQVDRRGNCDFVDDIYDQKLFSEKFRKAITPIVKSHGYSYTCGALTDVYKLSTRGVGLSIANMSAGYYNPHTSSEYINITDLNNVTNMCYNICKSVTRVYTNS